MQLALLGALLALEDTGERGVFQSGRTGVILGTGLGATCNTLNFQSLSPRDESSNISPISFSHSVDNVAAASIASLLEEHAPNITINHFDMSVPLAFMTALSWLRAGRVDRVLVGCVDEFAKISAYDQARFRADGSVGGEAFTGVGEGSAFFVLGPASNCRAPYGCISEARTWTIRGGLPEPDAECVYFWDHGIRASKTEELLREGLRGCPSVSYLGLYGYLPVGLGLALAIAALSRESNVLYPAVPEHGRDLDFPEPGPLDGRRIRCLRPGQADEWGGILLEPQ
jgi:hypothetical protein